MDDYYYEPETGAYSFADDDLDLDECEGDLDGDDLDGDDLDGDDLDGETVGPDDLSDDAEALASVGWGTDEDYGGYDGGDEW